MLECDVGVMECFIVLCCLCCNAVLHCVLEWDVGVMKCCIILCSSAVGVVVLYILNCWCANALMFE